MAHISNSFVLVNSQCCTRRVQLQCPLSFCMIWSFYLHWPRKLPKYVGVSKNSGTPKSSILIGFSTINHPFWGTPIFGNYPYVVLVFDEPIEVFGTHACGSWWIPGSKKIHHADSGDESQRDGFSIFTGKPGRESHANDIFYLYVG